MYKHFLIAAALAASVSTANAAESAFVIHLEGMAALCHITGQARMVDAAEIKRRNGAQSQKYRAHVEKAFADASKCVTDVKESTKEKFREQIAENPSLRQPLTDAYAAWLGVIDWLRVPRDYGEYPPGEDAYKAAINRLKAEFAAM